VLDTLHLESLEGTTFNFSIALRLLKLGHKINRSPKGTGWLEIIRNRIFRRWEDGNTELWNITSEDLLNTDYMLMK